MTAFARADARSQWGDLSWELRSVNHRYLELSLRLPEEMRTFEPRFREMMAACVRRGRIDAVLRFEARETLAEGVDLDEAATQRLAQLAARAAQLLPGAAPLRVGDVLRWPGVLTGGEIDAEGLAAVAAETLSAALGELAATRRREGERLTQMVEQRLHAMRQAVQGVRAVLPEAAAVYREKLEQRLAEIRDQLEPERLEQEIVLFLQKTDVEEELDRLSVHVDEVGRVLQQKEPVGRRLDFLMQELNREANTLGSKSVDMRLRNASVELKVLIEQIREQVQNIE